MKLLGWMHRKFRQNIAPGDPFRDFPGGGHGHPCNCLSGRPSMEELQPHYPHHSKTPSRPSLRSVQDHRLFGDDDYYEAGQEEQPPPAMNELLLHGLLAIGTLGFASPLQETTGSATPTFGAPPPELLHLSLDSIIAEKEPSEATEVELKAINAELEKVLVPEPGDKNERLSSARASHVSLKHLAAEVCPLQGYLFGSPVDVAETTESAAERREHRASLGELFMKSRLAEEGGGGGGGKKGEDRERSMAGMQLMVKKMLKRRGSKADAASRGGAGAAAPPAGGNVGDEVTAETKFHKILQKFHRKVHPETSIAHKKHFKSGRHVDVDASGRAGGGCEAMVSSAKGLKKDGAARCVKCQTGHPPPGPPPAPASASGSDSNGNREYWIKTDADYLVLEL